MNDLRLALKLLRRDGRAGELALLAVALVIAVASLATVGLFSNRVQGALARQSNQLVGADLTIAGERPLDATFEQEARTRGLAVTRAQRFPSMVSAAVAQGESADSADSVLADIKAVAEGYPLRGEVRIADTAYGASRIAAGIPSPGTLWADARLVARLNLATGTSLRVGHAVLKVAAVVLQEPDTDIGLFSAMPHLVMNEADLAATGLLQEGSRVRYRLYAAGSPSAITAYEAWARAHAPPWQNIEGPGEARPMLRNALKHAEQFLGIASAMAAAVAAAAIALAARRFCQRHRDACALMRCLGASRARVLRLYVIHLAIFGLAASLLGCVLGYGAQAVLGRILVALASTPLELPEPALWPALASAAAGLVLLAACALPPLAALGGVPALHALRRIESASGAAAWLYAPAVLAILGIVVWRAGNVRLGAISAAGFLGAAVLAAGMAALAILALGRRHNGLGLSAGGSRLGLANLRRRMAGSVAQVAALAVGIMALLTLTVVRGDLERNWEQSLPPDAPNRFLMNIQPDQVAPVLAAFSEGGLAPRLYPMVKGRLVAVNGREISSADYQGKGDDGRARRLLDREFNLSWMRDPPGNPVTSGRWWTADEAKTNPGQWSVEEGIAKTLGLKLGDKLTYDIAGTRVEGTVTSLRQVEWSSFRVNFFVVAPPELLRDFPATYITSVRTTPAQAPLLNKLSRDEPGIVIIDVAQILEQIQRMMGQAAGAMQFLFLFTLAAGLSVLYAALANTRDERLHEAAVMRALGARSGQVLAAQCAEFAAIGALAGLLGAAGAEALGWALAKHVLEIDYQGWGWAWLLGPVLGALGVTLAGWLGTRKLLKAPPLGALRAAE